MESGRNPDKSVPWKGCGQARYIPEKEFRERVEQAVRMYEHCRLCGHGCGVDRNRETGICGAGPEPVITASMVHLGEEPPFVTGAGAGAIFFSSCSLSCLYCQNHQISRGGTGRVHDADDLATVMLALQTAGCRVIDLVTPTHYLPSILEAIQAATRLGLTTPILYNTSGFDSVEALNLLDGIVDIYLPDMKYRSSTRAERCSGASVYPEINAQALDAMLRQVGNLELDETGAAVRGVLVRHLVMPGGAGDTAACLNWLARNAGSDTWLSLMAQYVPPSGLAIEPPLDRRLTEQEYNRAIDAALRLGFNNLFTQEIASADTGAPDFEKKFPFDENTAGLRIDTGPGSQGAGNRRMRLERWSE